MMRIDKRFFSAIVTKIGSSAGVETEQAKAKVRKIGYVRVIAGLTVLAVIVGVGVFIGHPKAEAAEVSAVLENEDGIGGAGSPNGPAVLAEDSSGTIDYFVYRIKKGDTILSLAIEYDVTQDTLISVNHITNSRALQVGQYLKIPQVAGIIHTVPKDGETPESIAEKYEKYDVDLAKILDVNGLIAGIALTAGATLFVPDAQLDPATLHEINGDNFRWPLGRRTRVSSYFAWRRSPFTGARQLHTGIDLPAVTGTLIYPTQPGLVSEVGYSNVYGNYVIVTHSAGYKTLYGHMSRIDTTKGSYVSNGTILGRVGNTGQSTGPHLHFTVYKNGRAVNPIYLLP